MVTAEVGAFLTSLSLEEQAKIKPVLERDLEFQRREKERIRMLQTNVELGKSLSNGDMRDRSGSTESFYSNSSQTASNASSSTSHGNGKKFCKTCGNQLGFIFNAGTKCNKCQMMVCDTCRSSIDEKNKVWLCRLCFQERELIAASNQWFYQNNNRKPEDANVSEVLLLQMRRATLHRFAESSNNMEVSKRRLLNYSPRRNMSLPPIASANLLKVPAEKGIPEHPMSALHRFIAENNSGTTTNGFADSIEEMDSETESISGAPRICTPPIDRESRASISSGSRFLEVKASWPGTAMLQTKVPVLGTNINGRTIRSNSLNVPDGTVALSIQIPDARSMRKTSECSCSRCSFVSDNDRPRSEMSDGSFDTTGEQKFHSRPQSEFNLDTLKDNYSVRGITHRSASADYFRRKSFSSDSQNQQSPSPPVEAQISRSSSRASSLSTRPSIDFSSGQLKFKLNYNLEMGSLDVHVIECRDLPHFGKHNPNPIVYVSLLPDDGYLEHSRVKTKCRKNTHSPLFEEVLKFSNLTKFELDDRILQFSVYHIDAFTKKSVIGECQVRIDDYPWSMTEPIWISLKKDLLVEVTPPDPEIHTRRGTLQFEISFAMKDSRKQRGDIHFFVKSGNNLTGDPPVLCKMPFIKINLLNRQKSIIRSARSALADFYDNGHEPVWNYDLVIQDQSLEKLKHRTLEVSVWDRENSFNNRYIGRLLFYRSETANSEKSTQTLWRQLLEAPKTKIVGALQLQP